MDEAFSQALSDWTGFYGLMGGAAATLLGLLFVAVSLRLNIFHRREVADVRDFAAFTFGTFLVAIAVAGLALAPHERRAALVWALLLIGVAGLFVVAWIARLWVRLNLPAAGSSPGANPADWRSWAYLLLMTGPYIGLIGVAVLLGAARSEALGWLALVEGWLLGMGTVAAWIMLSHADSPGGGGTNSD